jgi:cytochrome c peroxidase
MHRSSLVLILLTWGCGGGSPADGEAMAGAGAGGSSSSAGDGGSAGSELPDPDPDPDPELSEDDWSKLYALAPEPLPAPPADPSNAWADDPAAAELGQKLFFDARFSGSLLDGDNDGSEFALGTKGETGKVACSGCHVPETGFSDTRTIRQQISLGSGWGLRRSPSLLDVGQSKLLMWDGRRDSFFNQAFGVLESEVEMNSSRLYAAQRVFEHHKAAYEAVFGALPPLDDLTRFPALTAEQTGCRALDRDNECTGPQRGAPGDGAEFDALAAEDRDAVTRVWVNVGKALGAYQRLLSCGPSRFDAWVNGDENALDRAEQRGAVLFVGKAGCVSCHSGPYLSDERFHNVGLQPQLVATVFIDTNDPGASVGLALAKDDPLSSQGAFSDGYDDRLPQVIGAEYTGAFRTPRLRCVAGRPAFMHTGQMASLEEVVEFFDRGGDNFGFVGESELLPLNLTPREKADLVAFLKALTGAGPAQALLAPP